MSQEREASVGPPPPKTQSIHYLGFKAKKLGQTKDVLRRDFGMLSKQKEVNHNVSTTTFDVSKMKKRRPLYDLVDAQKKKYVQLTNQFETLGQNLQNTLKSSRNKRVQITQPK